MKPLVIYHANCADGFGAAFAAWLKLGDEAEYLPMDYGQRADWMKKKEYIGRDVYILDFSFSNGDTNEIIDDALYTVILDHHKTAFENLAALDLELGISKSSDRKYSMLLDSSKSGSLIAWEYFHHNEEVPMLIRHIDDYDRWQFKLEGTKAFNKALWSYAPWSFEQWRNMLPGGTWIDEMRREGESILRAHEQNVHAVVDGATRKCAILKPTPAATREDVKEFCRSLHHLEYQTQWFADGLAANCPPHLASDVGHELANRSGTYGLLWYIDNDGICKCSLRSNGDYDVSAIAKAFGGGGHRNAAGFQVHINTLLEWIK